MDHKQGKKIQPKCKLITSFFTQRPQQQPSVEQHNDLHSPASSTTNFPGNNPVPDRSSSNHSSEHGSMPDQTESSSSVLIDNATATSTSDDGHASNSAKTKTGNQTSNSTAEPPLDLSDKDGQPKQPRVVFPKTTAGPNTGRSF